jgi:hypothetical protein
MWIQNNARSFTECTECGIPRVIFSKKKLTEDQIACVTEPASMYSCGAPLFEEGHEYYDIVVVRRCSLTVSKPELKAPTESALEARI